MNEKQTRLEQILKDVVTEGEYDAALLSDRDGLTLAAAEAEGSAGLTAATASLLRKAAQEAEQRLDLAHVNELSLVSDDRFRFVCRFFDAGNGQALNLTVVVPPDHYYRRVTNEAIKRLRQVWEN